MNLSYAACVELLASIPQRGLNPKLEATVDMLAYLGLERPPYDVIQVAGTNGKSSTSRIALPRIFVRRFYVTSLSELYRAYRDRWCAVLSGALCSWH